MGVGLAPAAQLIRPSVETRHEVRKALTAAPQFAQIDPPTQQELAYSLVRIAEAARVLAEAAERPPAAAPARAPAAVAMNAGEEFSGTAVDRIAGTPIEAREEAIWVQIASGNLRLPIAQIEWVEAARDYVLLHTATRSYIHRISMAALEQLLDPAQLMRVHRSTFIRPALVRAVQRLGKGLIALEMEDGSVVQVGPSYAGIVLERLGLL